MRPMSSPNAAPHADRPPALHAQGLHPAVRHALGTSHPVASLWEAYNSLADALGRDLAHGTERSRALLEQWKAEDQALASMHALRLLQCLACGAAPLTHYIRSRENGDMYCPTCFERLQQQGQLPI